MRALGAAVRLRALDAVSAAPARVAALLAAAIALFACQPYPSGRWVVRDVSFEGVRAVPQSELREGIGTRKSQRFLGIRDGIAFDYEVLDESLLAEDVARIERFYRARGYFDARVLGTEVSRQRDGRHVRVRFRIHEGDPVLVTAVDTQIEGLSTLEHGVAAAAWSAVELRAGDRFDQARYQADRDAIVRTLKSRGHAFARVEAGVDVDVARRTATVRYHVLPGVSAKFGAVEVVGLERLPARPVTASLRVREGRPYSLTDLRRTERALLDLGTLATVDVREDLADPASGVVPVTVGVREGKLRAVRLGGGASLDDLTLNTHLRVGWEDRNFLGGMQYLSVDTRPGINWYPLRIALLTAPTLPLLENMLRAELRRPVFPLPRMTSFIRGDYNVYPLLYRLPEGTDPSDERIIGYNELKGSVGVEQRFIDSRLTVTVTSNLQANFPFTYQGDMPDGLETVLVAFPELLATLDLRDDPIAPRRGAVFSMSLQTAGLLGAGDLSDVRLEPEIRGYYPLGGKFVLAMRAKIGMLFPFNYGQSLDPAVTSTDPAYASPDSPAVIDDQHRLLFRVFYSGGPGSNRGYPYRGVGPHGPLGFLVQSSEECSFVYDPSQPESCNRPLGGLTLWELSTEVRYPIAGALHGVAFLDMSQLTRDEATFDFRAPHPSLGAGLRYMTPVGALRFDLAFRLKRSTYQDDPSTPEDEETLALAGEPEPDDFCLFRLCAPIAVHIAIGEAF